MCLDVYCTVKEIKGLLEGIEEEARYLSYNLASDNVANIDTTKIKAMIDRIDSKKNELNANRLCNEDDIFD